MIGLIKTVYLKEAMEIAFELIEISQTSRALSRIQCIRCLFGGTEPVGNALDWWRLSILCYSCYSLHGWTRRASQQGHPCCGCPPSKSCWILSRPWRTRSNIWKCSERCERTEGRALQVHKLVGFPLSKAILNAFWPGTANVGMFSMSASTRGSGHFLTIILTALSILRPIAWRSIGQHGRRASGELFSRSSLTSPVADVIAGLAETKRSSRYFGPTVWGPRRAP